MRAPISVFKIADRSMEPKLHEGDYVIVNKWHGEPRIGDIVVLFHPQKRIPIIKRIMRMEDGLIYVSGDNRTVSQDSRHFGPIGVGNIIGKMLFKV